MANIKDLKIRIKSTKGTFKITSAMKLVSAAKLAKAQSKIVGLRPYAEELELTVKTVSALTKDYSHEYLNKKENKQSILLVVSSNKGLCGGYNTQLYKYVTNFLKQNSDREYKVYYIGKKVRELLQDSVNNGKNYTFTKADPTLEEVRVIAQEFADLFISGEVGQVCVAYNSFISAINFESKVAQLLPMVSNEQESEELKSSFPYDFKYEPSPNEIMDTLIPEVYQTMLYKSVLDAIASEHGSRMNAMENATKNCKEMIRSLTLKMNKLRQAAITTELIEVVSGAESLNS
jgi:F-type H+-transporting ATPase subunit gamma